METKINSEISERIFQIIEYVRVTPNKFSKNLGYDRTQTIYDILNKKSAPSFDFFKRLFNSEYSEFINPIWLLTGRGKMSTPSAYDIQPDSGFVQEPAVQFGCSLCASKDIAIASLQEANSLLREKIKLLEKGSAGKGSDYSKTA